MMLYMVSYVLQNYWDTHCLAMYWLTFFMRTPSPDGEDMVQTWYRWVQHTLFGIQIQTSISKIDSCLNPLRQMRLALAVFLELA